MWVALHNERQTTPTHLLLRVITAAATVALCPCSISSSAPEARSQTRPSMSPLVVTALQPSAEMVTLVTKPPWPASTYSIAANQH